MQIDKNIPIPPKATRRGRPPKYSFARMAPGDSVLIDTGVQSKAYNAAMSYGRVHGKKFCGRKTKEGFRIWRVE